MVCDSYTSNVECCILQVLCDTVVVAEFDLSELRVTDRGDSFAITDGVTSMDFSNKTFDLTAAQVRALRCDC